MLFPADGCSGDPCDCGVQDPSPAVCRAVPGCCWNRRLQECFQPGKDSIQSVVTTIVNVVIMFPYVSRNAIFSSVGYSMLTVTSPDHFPLQAVSTMNQRGLLPIFINIHSHCFLAIPCAVYTVDTDHKIQLNSN